MFVYQLTKIDSYLHSVTATYLHYKLLLVPTFQGESESLQQLKEALKKDCTLRCLQEHGF